MTWYWNHGDLGIPDFGDFPGTEQLDLHRSLEEGPELRPNLEQNNSQNPQVPHESWQLLGGIPHLTQSDET